LVANIVAHKLDVKELILLIPVEERPHKKRPNLQFDNTTGQPFLQVDETPTTFEKDFLSVEYLTYALSV
jgi:hypothetical protein